MVTATYHNIKITQNNNKNLIVIYLTYNIKIFCLTQDN
jgi:hypothetical protein